MNEGIEEGKIYVVVVNSEEQYSLWPLECPCPAGWSKLNVNGNKAECLAFINQVWIDSTPLSLRERIGAQTLIGTSEAVVSYSETKKTEPAKSQMGICIQELFEQQVTRVPNTAAVVFHDRQLSYADLNARANRLAHLLMKKGVGPGSVIAIIDERTPGMIISQLGVLKAGGTYLPIDASNPTERILSILDDSKSNIVLTRDHAVKGIPFSQLLNLNPSERVFVTDPRPQIKQLDDLPFPDRNLVDYNKYSRHVGDGGCMGSISIVATRGCPYKCLYCHTIWPKTHVVRSAQNIFDEIRLSYERGHTTFVFLDDIFNLDRRNSEAFFELVIKNALKIRILFPNGLRGDLLTPDYIDLMTEAGVVELALALETASPRLQRLIHKNLNIERLRENIEYICKNHPSLVLDLLVMFGFPTETEDEALITLNFIKSIKWLHFPIISALKIFPNTEMAHLAIEHGILKETIEKASHLAYHELSDTLPFPKKFAREYQSNFLADYFLQPDRLNYVLPIQRQVFTHDELMAKYDIYLPGGLEAYPEVAHLIGTEGFYSDKQIPKKQDVISSSLPISPSNVICSEVVDQEDGLRVLLLDLSQNFSLEPNQISNILEAPLGLMCLLTYLNREHPGKIRGKILKSMIDFDSFAELKRFIYNFQPQLIGIRTLSLYKDFFHKTVSLIKQWCPDVPIIGGGPYATSEYTSILSDQNIDVVVLGEGELTFSELIGKIIENGKELPDDNVLSQIPGLAFVPRRHEASQLKAERCRQILLLDEVCDEIGNQEICNPITVNSPADVAYTIYTSGSTGVPKGVQIAHSSVLTLLRAYEQIAPSAQALVGTSVCPFGFDVSVWECLSVLCFGGTLHLLLPENFADPSYFANYLIDHQVTSAYLPPALLHELANELEKRRDEVKLNRILVGVEPIKQNTLQQFRNLSDQMRIVNGYGPTESTICATFFNFMKEIEPNRRTPIGTAIPGYKVYIVDHNLCPVSNGETGEILIGGAGLAIGYLNHADLTADKFIPNPFDDLSGTRVYKTGDLARYLPDGNIEYAGRVDYQVKIRGFRIELGEIEAAISQYSGVQECVVIAGEDNIGGKRLVAYTVPSQEKTPTIEDLRFFLKERLPDYMIPSTFLSLEKFPLTPNGKVDRSALPLPEATRPELKESFVAPRSQLEKILAEIWAEVLKVEHIGVNDNFFELGGNSLYATQIVSRLRMTLQIELPLNALFKMPTISGLAEAIEKTKGIRSRMQSPAIGRISRERHRFQTTSQGLTRIPEASDDGGMK